MAIATSTAILAAAAASTAGTVMAAKSQSSAAKSAANAQQAATDSSVQLAREQRDYATGLLAPYRDDRARAYEDALLYGSGSYGGSAPNSATAYGAGPAASQSLEAVLRAQNPDMASFWDRWEANDKGKANGHRAVFGDFAGYVQAERPQALAAAQAQVQGGSTGQAYSGGGAAPGATSVTRADVEAQIAANPLNQYASQDLTARNTQADSAYGEETSLATDERGQGYNVTNSRYAALNDLSGAERGAAYGTAGDLFGARSSLAGNEQTDALGLASGMAGARGLEAGRARGDAEGLAYGDLGFRFGEADNVFGQRAAEAAARRGDVEGVINRGLTDRQVANTTARDTRFGEIEDSFGRFNTEAGRARTDREAVGLGNRDALRGVGTANFDRTLGYLDEDLATRKGYTDTAVADRAALNAKYQGQAQDRVASMLGVTGQVGKAARAGAERANELNLEFADTSRGWRNQDYDPYAQGRLSANAERGGVDLEAERGYGAAKSNAVEKFAGDSLNALGYRTDARGAALTDYTDEGRRAYDSAYTGLKGTAEAYGDAQTAMIGERSGARTSAYDAYSGANSDAAKQYAADMQALITYYGGDVKQAQAAYYARMNSGTSDLYAQRGAADTRYYGQRAGNEADKFAAYAGYDGNFYDKMGQSLRSRNTAKSSAYDQYAGAKAAAYGDWTNSLKARTDRDFSAAQGQAGYGRDYTQAATSAYASGADAYANAQFQRGNTASDLYGNLATIAGNTLPYLTRKTY